MPSPNSLPKKIHRVSRRLADGTTRWHFYAWRGGPSFWVDKIPNPPATGFYLAYADAFKQAAGGSLTIQKLVDDFLNSTGMPNAPRSKKDLTKWALRFAGHFHNVLAATFEQQPSRGDMTKWQAQWKHSPRQHDGAGGHAVRVLNWAVQQGLLTRHCCHKLKRLYSVDRSGIIWRPDDIKAIKLIAPEWVQRILCLACETGLRPGDLIKLTRNAVEKTPGGRRLRVRTNKRNTVAYIPVTPALGEIIDATPQEQMLILSDGNGEPLTTHRAAEGLRKWRNKAGVNCNLRLQDCRGTAATRLLDVGLTLGQIANWMGWSIRHAANVIENYARASPDTDRALITLENYR